jgi:HK97 family phage major capsid protein
MSMQELLQKRAGLIAHQETILSTIKAENRNMSVDEKSGWDKIDADISGIEETVERLKTFEERVKTTESKNYKDVDFTQKVTGTTNDEKEFKSMGEFFVAVAKAGSQYGRFPGAGTIDQRLNFMNAAAGHSANVPSDGGFLIAPTRSNEIMQRIYGGGEIVSGCRVFDIGEYSDSLEVPYMDETSRVAGSRWGGLRAYREGEVDTSTASKTKLGQWECRVSDLKALVYVTERLLNDAPALESLIMSMMPEEFVYKLEEEILSGNGGLQCKGIIGDAGTVSVTKETGQAATTILYENIIKMWTRCWGRSRGAAKWYHNQDVETELLSMTLNAGTAGVPLFIPPNGISGSPYATLLGKPLVPVEQAETLGTVGDIILADFSQYALVRKGGMNTSSSIHVKFLTDEMTFKFSMRVNGKPMWKSVLTPAKGSNTLSPFVTVATR